MKIDVVFLLKVERIGDVIYGRSQRTKPLYFILNCPKFIYCQYNDTDVRANNRTDAAADRSTFERIHTGYVHIKSITARLFT